MSLYANITGAMTPQKQAGNVNEYLRKSAQMCGSDSFLERHLASCVYTVGAIFSALFNIPQHAVIEPAVGVGAAITRLNPKYVGVGVEKMLSHGWRNFQNALSLLPLLPIQLVHPRLLVRPLGDVQTRFRAL